MVAPVWFQNRLPVKNRAIGRGHMGGTISWWMASGAKAAGGLMGQGERLDLAEERWLKR